MLDELMYRLPLLGSVFKRLYSYFKKHTAFTDLIHVCLGLGVGLLIGGAEYLIFGWTFLLLGILGHIYAYIKG